MDRIRGSEPSQKDRSLGRGPAQTLCSVAVFRGGAWSQNGVILFSQLNFGLFRVAAQGGTPNQVTTVGQSGAVRHRWPVFLPDGRHFLYNVTAVRDSAASGIFVGDLESKQTTRLVGDESSGAYSVGPSGGAYLLFVRAGTLMAQPLDIQEKSVFGDAFPVADRVGVSLVTRKASFSVSAGGLLVYDSTARQDPRMTWLDRNGKKLGTSDPGLAGAALSPDDKHLAATLRAPGANQTDLWL
jgi:Tol biopolymer transport system component